MNEWMLWSLPLANRLEKSVSVRLKRASPPVLSQDSRFLAARSLKELTILLLSSRLLFFCKNPKRLQEEEESAGWLHFPYMSRAAAVFFSFTLLIRPTINNSPVFLLWSPLSFSFYEKRSHPAQGVLFMGGGPCGRLSPVTSASNSSQAQTNGCHVEAVNSY